jgi:hypothetical protein
VEGSGHGLIGDIILEFLCLYTVFCYKCHGSAPVSARTLPGSGGISQRVITRGSVELRKKSQAVT